MIIVVNAKIHRCSDFDVLIDRRTPLGNPYPLPKYSREESIQKYKEEFYKMMITKSNTEHLDYLACRKELGLIYTMNKRGPVYLVCWCKPLACHGDVIKEFIDNIK